MAKDRHTGFHKPKPKKPVSDILPTPDLPTSSETAATILPQEAIQTTPTPTEKFKRDVVGKQILGFLAAVIVIVSLVATAFQLAGVITMEIAHWLIFFAAVVAITYICIFVFTSSFFEFKSTKRKIVILFLSSFATIFIFYLVDSWMVNKRAEIDRNAEQERIANFPPPVTKLEDKKSIPEFEGNLEWFAIGIANYKGKKYTAVTCLTTIKNLGMPSAATDWFLVIRIKDEKPFAVKPQHIFNELTLGREGKLAEVISDKDFIYDKTLKPIATGEIVKGYLHFWINREKEKVNAQGTTMEIVYSDITGKQFSILENKFPIMTDDYQIQYTPGVQIKEKSLKQATKK